MNQIAFALYIYHEIHGCFPPAHIPDAEGKPMHSWRVLLLPHMEGRAVYEAYNFSEPWDGPNNRRLAGSIPLDRFHCPGGPHVGNSQVTDYVLVTGPGTAFPGAKSTSYADFRDGKENTIILVEIQDSDIHWMEPRDLDIEHMSFAVNDRNRPSISAPDPSGPGVVFADGISVYRLRKSLRPDTLKGLLTIRGGGKVGRNEILNSDPSEGRFLAE